MTQNGLNGTQLGTAAHQICSICVTKFMGESMRTGRPAKKVSYCRQKLPGVIYQPRTAGTT